VTDPIENLIAAAKIAHSYMILMADEAQGSRAPAVRNAIEDCEARLRNALAAAEHAANPADDAERRKELGRLRAHAIGEIERVVDDYAERVESLGAAKPTQCRPHCTTMATECDYCQPEKPASLLDLHGLGRDVAPHVEPEPDPPTLAVPGRFWEIINELTDSGRATQVKIAEALALLAETVQEVRIV
jgi:DNA-binding Lrp family transcriptional regulator